MSYPQIFCTSLLAFSGFASPAQAALFSGSSSLLGPLRWDINGGSPRTEGTNSNLSSTLELQSGTVTTDISITCPGVTVGETYSVANPSTSEAKIYYISVFFDPMEIRYNVGPITLTPTGDSAYYSSSSPLDMRMMVSGSYLISGDSTASGTFSTILTRPSAGIFSGSIDFFPGDPQLIRWFAMISNTFNATSNPLFSAPIEGGSIDFNLRSINLGSSAVMNMQAVPEPQAWISASAIGMLALARRRRA